MPSNDGFDDFSYDEYHDYYENNVEAGFDMFDRLPGTEFLSTEERAEAFELFYSGYVEGGDRSEFLEFMGMDEADFPWEDWREWMGYE